MCAARRARRRLSACNDCFEIVCTRHKLKLPQGTNLVRLVEDDAVEGGLEPLHGIRLGQLVVLTNLRLLLSAASDAVARSFEDDVEVHTVNTGGRIVLDTEIDVFGDTKAKVTGGTKVSLEKFKFLHLETALLCVDENDVDG